MGFFSHIYSFGALGTETIAMLHLPIYLLQGTQQGR